MTQPTVVMTFILLLFTHHSYAVIWRLPAVSDSSRALPRKAGARPSSSDTRRLRLRVLRRRTDDAEQAACALLPRRNTQPYICPF